MLLYRITCDAQRHLLGQRETLRLNEQDQYYWVQRHNRYQRGSKQKISIHTLAATFKQNLFILRIM